MPRIALFSLISTLVLALVPAHAEPPHEDCLSQFTRAIEGFPELTHHYRVLTGPVQGKDVLAFVSKTPAAEVPPDGREEMDRVIRLVDEHLVQPGCGSVPQQLYFVYPGGPSYSFLIPELEKLKPMRDHPGLWAANVALRISRTDAP